MSTTTATPDQANPTPTLKPCECSLWEIGITSDADDGVSEPDVTIETTGCTAETAKLFAPGHDAKLKALILRAYAEGKEIRYGRGGGVLTTFPGPVEAAARFGFRYQIGRAVERINAERQRQANKTQKGGAAAKTTAKQPTPPADPSVVTAVADCEAAGCGRVVVKRGGLWWHDDQSVMHDAQPINTVQITGDPTASIKVGRWTYPAWVNTENGVAAYQTKDGEWQVRERDGYQLLEQPAQDEPQAADLAAADQQAAKEREEFGF